MSVASDCVLGVKKYPKHEDDIPNVSDIYNLPWDTQISYIWLRLFIKSGYIKMYPQNTSILAIFWVFFDFGRIFYGRRIFYRAPKNFGGQKFTRKKSVVYRM